MAKNVEAIRAKVAKAQEEQDAAHRKYKEAEKRTKAAARELLAALAGDLDLSRDERRALGLRKGGN